MSKEEFFGFEELNQLLDEYKDVSDEGSLTMLETTIVKDFVNDLKKLPSPKSHVSKPTHLVDTFAYQRDANKIVVGWGVYYGRFVEYGTALMRSSHPHMMPLWNSNVEKYIENFKKKYNFT